MPTTARPTGNAQILRQRPRRTRQQPGSAPAPAQTHILRKRLALGLVLGVTILTFLPVLWHEFTNWDDPQNVASNPLVLSPSWDGLAQIWSSPVNNMYAPLVFTSFMVDALLGGGHPWAFHATNLILHLGSTAAVFFILRFLVPAPLPIAAAAGALLFAVHPLQAEPVAWVTGRKDVLAGCLGLLAVALHLASDRARSEKREGVLLVTAAIAYTLSLLAKATVVALPLALLVVQVLIGRQPLRQSALRLTPWFVAAGIISLVAMAAEPKPEWLADAVPVWQRPLLAGYALLTYTGKILWPASLAPVYPVNAPEAAASSWSYVGLVGGLFALAAAAYHRGRPAAVLCLIFAPLLPVLGLVPFLYQQISMTADRYAYLSLLGVALAVAWTTEAFWPREKARPIVLATLVPVIAVCCVLTNRQVRFWHDSETLWKHAVEVSPGVAEAHTNLAFALHHKGDLAPAERQLELAVQADPRFQ